jgi:ribosomal protein S18 acetylase RimI-like enzyme
MEIRLATENDLIEIKTVAYKTWPSTYGEIMSPAQLNYMLMMIYDESSLLHQLNILNHQFVLAKKNNELIGFGSFSRIDEEKEFFKLHKLYILPLFQGNGIGDSILNYIIDKIRLDVPVSLLLNVNRDNPAIHFYKKKGFNIIGSEDIDIGNGFFMNDYVMEKIIL